jgi:hypothetical protein
MRYAPVNFCGSSPALQEPPSPFHKLSLRAKTTLYLKSAAGNEVLFVLLLGLSHSSRCAKLCALGAALSLALCLVPVVGAAAGARSSKERSSPVAGSDYIAALATANHFLHAWQTGDQVTGILLLTDNARKHSSEENFSAFFTTSTRPAYEIARGKKLKTGRYLFPIALFDLPENPRDPKRARQLQLIVCRTGKDDWAVDKLP